MSCTNPPTPDFTKTKPVFNKNCVTKTPAVLVYPGGVGGKTVNIYASTSNVVVETLRGQLEDDFFVGHPEYTEPSVSLSITSPTGIQLSGTTVDNVSLSWSYNKPMQSQKLFIGGVEQVGLVFTDNGNNSYSIDLTSLGIEVNTAFKIEGFDGTKNVSASKTLQFGFYLVWVEGIELDENSSNSAIAAVLEPGNKLGPLATRAYGSPYIQPQSINPAVFFYVAIEASQDNISVDTIDKFYEHDGDDKGGGMFLMKKDVPLDLGNGAINYNIYRALFGAQGGALFEMK